MTGSGSVPAQPVSSGTSSSHFMMSTYLDEDAETLDGFEFMTMVEVGEVGEAAFDLEGERTWAVAREGVLMSRLTVVLCVLLVALASATGASASRSASVAALQVALRAQGLYVGSVDGVAGPLTKRGLAQLQSRRSLRPAGGLDPETRRALGTLGAPLLGQRLLGIGAEGWDVSALEFKLTGFGLRRSAVDGRFTAATAVSLRRFQRAHGLQPDGIAGAKTYRALAGGLPGSAARTPATAVHTVQPGEGFYTIASHYHVSALALARRNGLRLTNVLLPGQRLRLP